MKRILINLSVVIVYLVILSIFSSIIGFDFSNKSEQKNITIGGTIEEVGVSEDVSVTVRRNRWYGYIIEDYSREYTNKNLYLFKVPIRIPIEFRDINYIYFHIIFIISLILFNLKPASKKIKREEAYLEKLKGGVEGNEQFN